MRECSKLGDLGMITEMGDIELGYLKFSAFNVLNTAFCA